MYVLSIFSATSIFLSSHLIRKCSLCTRYSFVKRLSVVWSNPSVFLLPESYVKKVVCNDLILSFFICRLPFSGLTCVIWSFPPPYSWTSLWLHFSSYRLAQLVSTADIESISMWSVGEANQTWNFYIQTDWVVSKRIILEQQQQWQELKMELKNWETLIEELRTSYMEINYRIQWCRDKSMREVLEKPFLLTELT